MDYDDSPPLTIKYFTIYEIQISDSHSIKKLTTRCEYNIHSQKRHRLVSSCQFYCRLVATCQQVATSLSISSSCNKSVKIRLVATCHLQTSYNVFKQLATSLLTTNLDNQHGTSLLTTCNRPALTSCRKPCERILILACCNRLFQDVNVYFCN